MDKFSYVGNADVNAIEDLYKKYRSDENSVDEGWKKFFEGFEFAKTDFEGEGAIPENVQKEFKVLNLINAYRVRGHLFTKTNPVRERRKYEPKLTLENFDLSEEDLDTEFEAGSEVGLGRSKLKNIIENLEANYCQSIGSEFMYIRDPERLQWLISRIQESTKTQFSNEEKKEIFRRLNKATVFEQFLQKKFVGQKRFSLEGGESLIPALNTMINRGAELGVKEFVIGMAHRGRLNVLTNIFDKEPDHIFNEFQGKGYEHDDDSFDGDVKYHLGYSTGKSVGEKKNVHLTLAPNPSHLEAVDPVVEGISRAKIDTYLNSEEKLVPVLIHGDAAIAAQGVVYEIVQMAGIDGYKTGGTIHIVVNNQVGFTTNYLDGRSSTYCTDVGKTTLSPVFHVNGDDTEAMIKVMQIAIEYRQRYKKDVFIDLLCYRKYGHNEGDEPKFTQPKLYKAISKHPNSREIYQSQLLEEGVVKKEDAKKMEEDFTAYLNECFDKAKEAKHSVVLNFLEQTWEEYQHGDFDDAFKPPKTGVAKKKLVELGKKMSTLPEGKKYFRKIKKLFDERIKMIDENNLDWGMGEMLAYATLLVEGHPIRVSGQDVERGTFSHRHAVVKTEDDEEETITLNLLDENQAEYTIYNSLLSEYGVLGFDYGYSLATPQGLTIWEAQFGDFNNGAQIMIDQFISSAEDKWFVQSGLVMFLPHGYEGMGSEHSSARMERFLQLSSDYNWEVCNPTTPANHFHLLRRQIKRKYRKPLVVFTPKMLLRYPKAVSTIEELASGSFQPLIMDPDVKKDEVKTVVFCSGKVYYDFKKEAEEREAEKDIAFVRLEQLYPLPQEQMNQAIKEYKNAEHYIWAQEEPKNIGAWGFILMNFEGPKLEVISRPSSAAPAAGASELHKKRYDAMMDEVFKYSLVKK